jgi:hypothetical protein
VTSARSRRLLVLSLLVTVAAAGCSRGAPSKEAVAPPAPSTSSASGGDPTEKHARAVAIATAFAIERGHDRNSFTVRSVKDEGGTARVFFDTEPRRPGSHFTVVVDTNAGKATKLIPGR